MRCPKCGSEKCRVIETTNTIQSSSYSCGKGCCGALLFGNILGALCGIGGKTKVNTERISYWTCDDCGSKFQHGMTEEMYEVKNAIDKFDGKVNFIKLDDSTEYLKRIRSSIGYFDAFPELEGNISYDNHYVAKELVSVLIPIVFKENIPDIVCCIVAKKDETLKKISNKLDSLGDEYMSLDEAIYQEADYGWNLNLYNGIIFLADEFIYYDGKTIFRSPYSKIKTVYSDKNTIKIRCDSFGENRSEDVSLIEFLKAQHIWGDKLRVFLRFLQSILMDTPNSVEMVSEEIEDKNGQNNSSVWNHKGKLYIFTESSSVLQNRSELIEISANGQYFSFELPKYETILCVDSDKNYLYFRSQSQISRISWNSLENRNISIEKIIESPKGIGIFRVVGEWLYYVRDKKMMRMNLATKTEEALLTNILCGALIVKEGNELYFVNLGEKKKLYRYNIKSGAVEQVMENEKIKEFVIANRKVFFYSGIMNLDLKMYDMDTKELHTLEELATGMCLSGDRIYYQKDKNIIEYTLLDEKKRKIKIPSDLYLGSETQLAGNFLCFKAKGSIGVNYIININDGQGRDI